MPTTVNEMMTIDLAMCPVTATIADAARMMRDRNIGDVLVTSEGELRGIVTDRDIVVRCLAEGATPDTTLDRVCSAQLTTVEPGCSIDDAAQVMRERALRRLPVVDNGRLVGIVSLGDLAIKADPDSALGEISAAQPNS